MLLLQVNRYLPSWVEMREATVLFFTQKLFIPQRSHKLASKNAAMEDVISLKYDRLRLSDDEFYDFCTQNGNLKFERDTNGNILIMPNTGGMTGNLNSELTTEITI